MEILVQRQVGTKLSTQGQMFVDGKLFSYTIEDVERKGVATDKSKKVYGKTAIPRGRYRVSVTMSNRFGRETLYIHDVPNFEGIRVHSGNTAEHSHGCVIVAKFKEGPDKIYGNSRALETKLTNMVKKAIASGEKVYLTVSHKDEGDVLVLDEVKV